MDFELIYSTYWDKIFRLCMGYVNDYTLAQDIAQETFIIVWEKLATFRQEADISTWIYRIATNNCLRQQEKQKRTISRELPVDLTEENRINLEPQIQLLYKLIAELSEINRIIISLELEGVKQADIPEIVGLSAGNIRVRLHRIKSYLTKRFKENGY